MNDSKHAILHLMNEYCYLIDAGDMEGFARLFEHSTFHALGDPAGASGNAKYLRTSSVISASTARTWPETKRTRND